MARRRALIVDRDKAFSARLRGCLRALGMVVDVAENRRATLDRIGSKPPSLVFIAVERPKKAGFSLFSDVKRLLKNVPIVLTTATVPMGEMMLHQKLRLHAEVYLDKRGITEAEILGALSSLLRLKLDSSDLAELAATVSRAVALSSDRPDDDDDELDRFQLSPTQSDIEPVEEDEPFEEHEHLLGTDEQPAGRSSSYDYLDPQRSVELEERVHSLGRELERARRAASSSPFSKEYLRLGDQLERADQRLVRVQAELELARRESEVLQTKLVESSRHRTEAERSRDRAFDHKRETDRRHSEMQQQLEREQEANRGHAEKLAEETGHRVRLEQDHAFAQEKLRDGFERERTEAIAHATAHAAQGHELESARWMADHEQSVAALKQQAKERLETECHRVEQEWRQKLQKLEQDDAAATEQRMVALERQHATVLEEQQQTAAEETQRLIDATNDEWQGRFDRLHEEHAEQIERLRRELSEERDSLTQKLYQERDTVVSSRDVEWQSKLEQLRMEHATRLTELRAEQTEQLTELTRAGQQELAERDRENARSLERLTHELRRERRQSAGQVAGDVERMGQEQREEIERLESRYGDEIEVLKRLNLEQIQELRSRHAAEKERTAREHTASLDELTERLRRDQRVTIEGQESDWQKRLHLLREEYDNALHSDREELQTVLEALEAARAEASQDVAEPADLQEKHRRMYRILGRTAAEKVSKPGRASELLRHLAAELDELGSPSAQPEIDMPDVDASFLDNGLPRND